MREFGRTRHELGHPAVTADSGCSCHVPSFSGDLVRPRLAGNMSEMLVGVRGFEPPAPASRKHCSACPGLDHLLSSAIDHLADVHIAKRTFRGVPIADLRITANADKPTSRVPPLGRKTPYARLLPARRYPAYSIVSWPLPVIGGTAPVGQSAADPSQLADEPASGSSSVAIRKR